MRWRRFLSCARISNGAGWDLFRNRPCGFASLTRSGTPNAVFPCRVSGSPIPRPAQCGEVLKGVLKPAQCKLFGNECTPEHPVGALMVSSEGSCAAYYNDEHRKA